MMATTRAPKISVCVPAYNYGRFIGEAIASVLTQEDKDLELVIRDDQSTDDTEQVVRSFDDPRLVYYRNPGNLGAYPNDNRCLALARGPYVCLLDADDKMLPGNLAAKARLLDERPEVGLVYSACIVIDSHSKERWVRRPFGSDYVAPPAQELTRLLFDNHIPFSSVMVRKSCYERLGNFDESFAHSGDYEMWLRIASYYHVAYLSTPLVVQRIHGENSTSRAIPDGRAEAESLASVERALANLPVELSDLATLKPRAVAQTSLRFAAYYFALGYVKRGEAALHRAICSSPEITANPATAISILFGPAAERLVTDRLAYIDTIFAHLPRETQGLAGLKRRIKSSYHIEQVFAAGTEASPELRRRHLWRGLRLDPSWLRNRGILAILIEMLIGRRAATWIRQLVRGTGFPRRRSDRLGPSDSQRA